MINMFAENWKDLLTSCIGKLEAGNHQSYKVDHGIVLDGPPESTLDVGKTGEGDAGK